MSAPHSPPPAARFFDTLLNPAVRAVPVFPHAMSSSSSRPQPGRLSNGYVDLTSPPVDLTAPHVDLTDPTDPTDLTDLTGTPSPPRRRKRDSPASGPSVKRLKHRDADANSTSPDAPIEQIDLSQDDGLLDVLTRQREEAVRAQARPVETVTTFNSFNCVICMDRPTDITATACGTSRPPP